MKRGFTVAELLITMALVLLLAGLAFKLLVPAVAVWKATQAQATLEETALVISSKIVRDVERSTPATVTPITPADPTTGLQAVAFASTGEDGSADSYDPSTGLPLWQFYVVYYVPAGRHDLYRKLWPVPWLPAASQAPPVPAGMTFPSSVPAPLTPGLLAQVCATRNGTERSLGTCVDVFGVSVLANQNGVLSLHVSTPSARGRAFIDRSQEFHFWM